MYEPLMHEIDVHNHLPPALDDIEEFIEITKVENKNFNRARIDLLGLFKMRFVHEADETGIARWEKMLKIKRRVTDGLEVRKMRVLAKLNNQIPYTWRSLQQYLDTILNGEKFEMTLNAQTYEVTLDIYGAVPDRKLLVNSLEDMLPLNIWYEIIKILDMVTFVIQDRTYHYLVVFPRTGEMVFEILETHQSNAHINLQDATYDYNVDFDVYEVETTNIQGALPVQDATYDYNVALPRTGEMEPISAQTNVFTARQATHKNAYSYQVIYPITGEAITGEGWFDQ